MLILIMTAQLNDVDAKARLADLLARIVDLPASRLLKLLPREWKRRCQAESSLQQAVCPSCIIAQLAKGESISPA